MDKSDVEITGTFLISIHLPPGINSPKGTKRTLSLNATNEGLPVSSNVIAADVL